MEEARRWYMEIRLGLIASLAFPMIEKATSRMDVAKTL
jgi:hypothetical protein